MNRRLTWLVLSAVGKLLHVPRFGNQHVADDSFAKHLNAVGQKLIAAALGSVLNDAFVPSGRLDKQSSFAQIVRTGLFDIDVLSGV